MATPSGTKLFEIYDQIRVDIFGTNDNWTATAASGIPTSVMDIYAQKIVSRVNGRLSRDSFVQINTTTGAVTPNQDQVYALIETGVTMLIKDTEMSLMKRLSSGLGQTVSTGEGVSVKNADGVAISTVARFQERIRAFLSDKSGAREDFRRQLMDYKYELVTRNRKRYLY
jgi:hypothetical protein